MRKILIGGLLFLALAGAHAQSLLEYYDSEFVTVNYQTFGGLSFVQAGVTYSAAFGLEQPLRDIIAANPRATPLVRTHVLNMKIGWMFFAAGLLTSVSAAYLAATIPSGITDDDYIRRISWALGLSAGGSVFLIAGPFYMQAGYRNLFQAVNIYNRGKIRQYKQP